MRLRSVLAFGAGYLFGTKAGRDRYQDITRSLRELASSDVAQQAIGKARTSFGLGGSQTGDSSEASEDQRRGDQSRADDDAEGWEHAEGGGYVPEQSDQDGQPNP